MIKRIITCLLLLPPAFFPVSALNADPAAETAENPQNIIFLGRSYADREAKPGFDMKGNEIPSSSESLLPSRALAPENGTAPALPYVGKLRMERDAEEEIVAVPVTDLLESDRVFLNVRRELEETQVRQMFRIGNKNVFSARLPGREKAGDSKAWTVVVRDGKIVGRSRALRF